MHAYVCYVLCYSGPVVCGSCTCPRSDCVNAYELKLMVYSVLYMLGVNAV